MAIPEPLLAPADLTRLREALAGYTTDAVAHLLGPVGQGAHSRGDLAGVARIVRDAEGATAWLVRLFLLGDALPIEAARAALDPLPLEAAAAAGIVQITNGSVRAGLEIRPYAEAGGEPWWVMSDLGADVRPGQLTSEHVLGIGNAALSLAQATPRTPVGRALDVGTGCGVQALHLGRHAQHVTATDLSPRALCYAATSAALSGQNWELRQGWFLDPVAGEQFDLIVANPPFVVSPGSAEHDYRDSGLAGDAACRELVRGLPGLLAPEGTAQLLANWIVPTDGSWQDRLSEWFRGSNCRAWVWQREVADLGEYVALWLRDAGHQPGTADWTARYDTWLDWFAASDVAAVGMGLITMVESGHAEDDDRFDVVIDDVPQPVEQPIGAEIAAWFERHCRLESSTPGELLNARYRPAAGLTHTRDDLLDPDLGWTTRRATLRQPHGMRWEIEVDDEVARIVAACASGATPMIALEVLSATSGQDATALAAALAPVLRDLVQRGVLLPEGPARREQQ